MRKFLLLFSTVYLAFAVSSASAQTILKVGAYHFPPYYNAKTGSGVTVDLIDFLNEAQDIYEFELVPTSPRRRYADIERGRFHIMMFEMQEWGWGDRTVETTPLLLTGGEVYVTQGGSGRDQSFFDNVKSRKLVGIAGYHYGFAEFNSETDFLKSNFDIRLTSTHEGNLRSVLAGRSDIAVVTKAYLRLWQQQNPMVYGKLLVSDQLDQEYRLSVLVGSTSSATAPKLWEVMSGVNVDGALRQFFEHRGLGDLVAF